MAWLSVFIAFLTLLATARITRIVTEDTITKPIRDRIHKKARPVTAQPDDQPVTAQPAARPPGRPAGRPDSDNEEPRPAPRVWRYLSKLVICPWCSGFWISLALTLAYFRMWLGVWPTVNLATGFAFAVSVFGLSWVSALAADWLDSPPPARHQVHHGAVEITMNPPTPPTN